MTAALCELLENDTCEPLKARSVASLLQSIAFFASHAARLDYLVDLCSVRHWQHLGRVR